MPACQTLNPESGITLVLDGETDRLIRQEDAWAFQGPVEENFKPLRFTCLATALFCGDTGRRDVKVWFGADGRANGGYVDVETATSEDIETVCRDAAQSMKESDCLRVLCYIEDKVYNLGAKVVTFNGVSFDFRLLAAQFPTGSREFLSCAELAWMCYDPCLEMLCAKGFPVGLKAMCTAFGLPQKLEAGSDAPQLWVSGDCETRKRVLLYCASDATLTHQLYVAIKTKQEICWISKRGHKCTYKLHDSRLHKASELAVFPLPDTSWMQKDSEGPGPIPRDSAFNWIVARACE